MRRSAGALALCGLLAAAAGGGCTSGGGGGGDDDVAGGDGGGDPGGPDARPGNPGDPDARGGDPGSPDAGGIVPAALPSCYHECSGASDCVTNALDLYSADNWDCDGGACQWTGCRSDGECSAAYADPAYRCGTVSGTSFASCYHECDAPADCVMASALYGADNWDCDGGLCRWTGCNDTTECTSTFMSNDYACGTLDGLALATCYHTCDSASDCTAASELFGTDNYECDGGLCRWTGCNDTTECTAAYMSPDWVCR